MMRGRAIGLFLATWGVIALTPPATAFSTSFQNPPKLQIDAGDRTERLIHANAVFNSGFQHWLRGKNDAALAQFDQALRVFQAVDEPPAAAHAFTAMGSIHRNLGNDEVALEFFKQAFVIQQDMGAVYNAGRSLTNMGDAYGRLNQDDQALRAYHRAVRLMQKVGDRPQEVALLQAIGSIYLASGDYPTAVACFHQALDQGQSSSSPHTVGICG